jgi:TetR/AcrR family transcriptional regulator, transcriptional repressor for nem operon
MSDSERGARTPGRPRAFDEDHVLAAAMDLFWRRGYAGASVPDISAATGLATSSLYNAYGSKLRLYTAALDRYLQRVVGGYMVGPLARGTAGLADVDAFLDRLDDAIELDPPRGCLAINTIAEFRAPPPEIAARTARYRAELRRGLSAALGRAAVLGEIPAEAVGPRAEALAPIVVAFNLLVASRAPASEARALLCAARSVAEGEGGA